MLWTSLALALPCGFRPGTVHPRPLVPRAAGDLLVRDAFTDHLNVLETEHFAIKWVYGHTPDPAHLDALVATLEQVWDDQIDRMAWLPPPGAEVYKLNVYLGYESDIVPTIDFEGGYVYADDAGFAYMVLSPGSFLWNDGGDVSDLVAHEFHHMVQARDWMRFQDPDEGAFWWEATASWAVPYVFEDPERANYGGTLLQPHISINTVSYDWEDEERGGKQYETAAFAYHLSEAHGVELIRDSWQTPNPDGLGVLAWLDTQLDVDQAFTDFAVDMALETHPRAKAYAQQAREAVRFSSLDRRVAAQVPTPGTDGWRKLPDHLEPEGYAWSRIDWDGGGHGRLDVLLEENRALKGYVGIRRGDETVVHPVNQRFVVQPDDVVRLVVVTTPANYRPGRRFPVEYSFAFVADPRAESARGCATTSSPGWSLFRR